MRSRDDDVRRWHYITRNIRTATPSQCLFVDTETYGTPIDGVPGSTLQRLSLWHAVSCRLDKGKVVSQHWYKGTTAFEFWDCINYQISPRRPLWIFAHNLGFDFTVLRFWLECLCSEYVFEQTHTESVVSDKHGTSHYFRGLAVVEDPPTILEFERAGHRGKIVAVDTYNYFRCSVKELGDSIGLPKLDMPDVKDSEEKMAMYCRRDVEIIFRAITSLMRLVHEHDLGLWRYTAPSQAFSAYRHRFMKHRILVHGNKHSIDVEREAYFGGRCECFYVGHVQPQSEWLSKVNTGPYKVMDFSVYGPIHVLDIQSAYPAVMLWHQYPFKIIGCDVMPSQSDVLHKWQGKGCIARVSIESHVETFPYRHDGRTEFCRGKFVTSLCGPELYRAFATNSVKSIGFAAYYEMEDIFSEYVAEFWNMRQKYREWGNEVMAELCKLFLNSLAGKFGQKSKHWQDQKDVVAPQPFANWAQIDTVSGKSTSYRSIAWVVQKEMKVTESTDSCPAIAAYITAYQRERLLQLIRTAGQDNVYYVDTDCLHVNDDGLANLQLHKCINDDTLGMLRLVGSYEQAEYHGAKNYTIGTKAVIAGVSATAQEIRPGVYRQPKFQKLPSVLSSEPGDSIRVDTVTIHRSQGLAPSRVRPDGRVDPPLVY